MEIVTWPASKNLEEKIKQELSRGHELANQLRMVFRNGDDALDGSDAKGFVNKILSSFTTSLSLLSVDNHSGSVALPTIVDSSECWDTPKPIRSEEMIRDRSKSSTKKRKAPHMWSKDATNFDDDGYAWRKYGQKHILHATHPRNYYRCSHKYEKGCKAIKQVQKAEDDPSLYRITYIGNHTCNHNLFKSPGELLILDDIIDSSSKFMITYGNTNLPYEYEDPIYQCYNSTDQIKNVDFIYDVLLGSSQSSPLCCDDLVEHGEQPAAMFESSEHINGSWLPALSTDDQLLFDDMAMMECFAQEIDLPINALNPLMHE